MTFEGQQMQGSVKIMEKFGSLTFQKIAHLVTAVDCQPMFDGGILINVLGQLKVECRISFYGSNYSNHLNTRKVSYSNGPNMSGCCLYDLMPWILIKKSLLLD